MSPLLVWSAFALASVPVVRVAGVAGARTVAVVLEKDGVVAGVPCNDAGAGLDAAVDGVLTCGPLPPVTGEVRVGLVRDGRLVDAGATTLPGAVALRVSAGGVVLGEASLLAGAQAGAPIPAAPAVLARVRVAEGGAAPVVRLRAPTGSSELVCRDDGTFPDAERNDGEHGCAGPALGARVEVFLDGGSASLGAVDLDPAAPFAFLVLDGVARKARAEPFAIPGFAPEVIVPPTPKEHTVVPLAAPPGETVPPEPPPPETVPVEPIPPAPGADDSGADPAGPPEPRPPSEPGAATPPPPKDQDQPGHSPVASRAVDVPPLALLVAVALGLGGGWTWRRRFERLPTTLRPLPSPAVLPGGPTFGEPASALLTDAPDALAAALLPALSRHRRVVVVGPPDLALPEVPDGPVYRAESGDCEALEAAVRDLARVPGPPVAVLVVGDTLSDDGAVAPSPAAKLRAGLPAGVWLGLLLPVASGPASGSAPAFPTWRVTGPPWSGTREEPS